MRNPVLSQAAQPLPYTSHAQEQQDHLVAASVLQMTGAALKLRSEACMMTASGRMSLPSHSGQTAVTSAYQDLGVDLGCPWTSDS